LITTKDLNLIKDGYFNILDASGFAIYLQSKNTKHYWGIILDESPTYRNFKVYHKHNQSDSYHRHKDAPTLMVAIQEIKNHDAFQMSGRK